MKNIISLFFVAVILVSCGKQYNCHCATTLNYNGGQGFYTSKTSPMSTKTTKKQATSICDREASNIDKTYTNIITNNGSWSSGGATTKTNCTVE